MASCCLAVLGLSSAEIPGEGPVQGVGKSCLCSRFVRPRMDEWQENGRDHAVLVSQEEFLGPEINRDHFLLFGETKRGIQAASAGCTEVQISFQIAEHTTFVDRDIQCPFPCEQKYSTRATSESLHTRDKSIYVCHSLVGTNAMRGTEFQVPLPSPDPAAGKSIGIDGYIYVLDPTTSVEIRLHQWLLWEECWAALAADRRGRCGLVLSKCEQIADGERILDGTFNLVEYFTVGHDNRDEQCDGKGRVLFEDCPDKMAIQCGCDTVPLFYTSAVKGVGIDLPFMYLAHNVLGLPADQRRSYRPKSWQRAVDARRLLENKTALGADSFFRRHVTNHMLTMTDITLLPDQKALESFSIVHGSYACKAMFKNHLLAQMYKASEGKLMRQWEGKVRSRDAGGKNRSVLLTRDDAQENWDTSKRKPRLRANTEEMARNHPDLKHLFKEQVTPSPSSELAHEENTQEEGECGEMADDSTFVMIREDAVFDDVFNSIRRRLDNPRRLPCLLSTETKPSSQCLGGSSNLDASGSDYEETYVIIEKRMSPPQINQGGDCGLYVNFTRCTSPHAKKKAACMPLQKAGDTGYGNSKSAVATDQQGRLTISHLLKDNIDSGAGDMPVTRISDGYEHQRMKHSHATTEYRSSEEDESSYQVPATAAAHNSPSRTPSGGIIRSFVEASSLQNEISATATTVLYENEGLGIISFRDGIRGEDSSVQSDSDDGGPSDSSAAAREEEEHDYATPQPASISYSPVKTMPTSQPSWHGAHDSKVPGATIGCSGDPAVSYVDVALNQGERVIPHQLAACPILPDSLDSDSDDNYSRIDQQSTESDGYDSIEVLEQNVQTAQGMKDDNYSRVDQQSTDSDSYDSVEVLEQNVRTAQNATERHASASHSGNQLATEQTPSESVHPLVQPPSGALQAGMLSTNMQAETRKGVQGNGTLLALSGRNAIQLQTRSLDRRLISQLSSASGDTHFDGHHGFLWSRRNSRSNKEQSPRVSASSPTGGRASSRRRLNAVAGSGQENALIRARSYARASRLSQTAMDPWCATKDPMHSSRMREDGDGAALDQSHNTTCGISIPDAEDKYAPLSDFSSKSLDIFDRDHTPQPSMTLMSLDKGENYRSAEKSSKPAHKSFIASSKSSKTVADVPRLPNKRRQKFRQSKPVYSPGESKKVVVREKRLDKAAGSSTCASTRPYSSAETCLGRQPQKPFRRSGDFSTCPMDSSPIVHPQPAPSAETYYPIFQDRTIGLFPEAAADARTCSQLPMPLSSRRFSPLPTEPRKPTSTTTVPMADGRGAHLPSKKLSKTKPASLYDVSTKQAYSQTVKSSLESNTEAEESDETAALSDESKGYVKVSGNDHNLPLSSESEGTSSSQEGESEAGEISQKDVLSDESGGYVKVHGVEHDLSPSADSSQIETNADYIKILPATAADIAAAKCYSKSRSHGRLQQAVPGKRSVATSRSPQYRTSATMPASRKSRVPPSATGLHSTKQQAHRTWPRVGSSSESEADYEDISALKSIKSRALATVVDEDHGSKSTDSRGYLDIGELADNTLVRTAWSDSD